MNIFPRRSLRFGLALFALAALTSTAGAVSPDIVIHQVSGVPTGCDVPATIEISQVQGSGDASPVAGFTVRVEGIVTGDFQGASGLNGFFIQDDTPDADPNTSEGLFILSNTAVSVGDRVKVSGTVAEFNGLTELSSVTAVDVCSTGNPLPAAVTYDLPRAAGVTFEPLEGMLVTFPEALTASEHFQLGRFGEITVSSDGRLFEPTTVANPGAAAAAVQDLNDRRRLLIDDGSNTQNPSTVPFLTPNVLRLGDTASGITGVMSFGFNVYRLEPTAPITFTRTNPRPAAPSAVGGEIRVASFNTLNYFTTLRSANSNARGADNATEFQRQQDKLVSAITGLNADVIGLIEIENNGATAIGSLVDALNTATAAGTYAFITEPVLNAANEFGGTFGADAIKVALVYRPASVTPVGAAQSSADSIFDRPPLIQTFQPAGSTALFTAVVNHFKSKSCGGVTGPDADQGDGQSCFNARRNQQASALATLLDTLDVPKALVIGDLNSNTEEDPIHTLETAGFTELSQSFVAAGERYSFVFNAQSGELDHALAAADLADNVTGATVWHINADEPLFLDYNTEFKPPALLALYQPDAYRSSDHDPIVVGLSFAPTQLIVVKHVIKDNGGDADAADFTMSVTATNPSTASFPGDEAGTTVTVESGSYSVGETGPSGYSASFSADCSGTIALHETKTCTVTNDDIAPTLTVNKVVDPATDTGTFNLQIDGSTAGTGAAVGDGGSTGAVPVNAGSHTVGETAAGSTNLSDYVTTIAGQCNADGTVSLAPGENKTCMITNTRKPPVVSQITASGLCQQFSAGTAPDLPTLGSGGQVEYSLKKDKVSQTNPGTFFYWVKVAVGAGATSAVVDQSLLTGNFTRLFSLGSGSQPVYNAGCASVRGATATQAANGDVTVNWTAGAGGTFYIGLKYSTSSLVGGAKPDPGTNVDYTFATTGVPGSTEGVRLSKKK
jgi:predicted extracellular nuclease